VSPMRYEQGFYIPEDGILHSHRRENLKSCIELTGWTLKWRGDVSPMRYEQGFYIPEDGILHSHRLENFKSYTLNISFLPQQKYIPKCPTAVTLDHESTL
jgi:hypothetical protein